MQDSQIKILASHLDKTIIQVNKHSNILKDLNRRVLLAEKSLSILFGEVNKLQYGLYLSNALRHKLSKCHIVLTQLEMACDEIYEVLRTIVSQQVSPVSFPPTILNDTLYEVKEQLSRYSNLCLPKNPERALWEIYPLLRMTPVILDDILILMLKIPLVDKKVNVTLYRIHNLPALHPRLGIGYHFILEGEYYMVTQDGKYEAIPPMETALACIQSRGHVCALQTALYRTQASRLCISALFNHNTTAINLYCIIDPHVRSDSLAMNLGHHVWAVSTLMKDTLHIRCPLTPNRIQTVKPPLTFLEIKDGCEVFSNSLYIPSTYQFNTASHEYRARMFIEFNTIYQQLALYDQWFPPIKPNLTEGEITKHRLEVEKLEPLLMHVFNQKLTELDHGYVTWMPSTETICLGLGVLLFVVFLILLGYGYWKCRKIGTTHSVIKRVLVPKRRNRKKMPKRPQQVKRVNPLKSTPPPEALEMTERHPTPRPRLRTACSVPSIEYNTIDELTTTHSLKDLTPTPDAKKVRTTTSTTLDDALTSLAQEHVLDLHKYQKYLARQHRLSSLTSASSSEHSIAELSIP